MKWWPGLLVVGLMILWPTCLQASPPLVVRSVDGLGRVNIRTVAAGRVVGDSATQAIGPEREYHALLTPNDPQFALQWNLGTMNVPGAWDAGGSQFFGDASVVVAIVDTGVAYTNDGGHHQAPDLASTNFWTNPGEIAEDGIDNDGNGYIDDVHGWNFVNNNNLPADDHGHGTHLAELIAAGTNNGQYAAGIAPNTTILPLKVLDSTGDGSTSAIAAAVEYAIVAGADIINLSLGGTEPDPVLAASVTNAVNHGILVVAAAGNDGTAQLNYPARYTNTLSVGGTQYDGTRAAYSNYSSDLDLSAPGGNVSLDQNGDAQPDGILQQTCDGGSSCQTFGLWYYSGTSQATAQVSGVAALVLACPSFTGNLSDILVNSATDLGAVGHDDQTGAGLVNAQAALAAVGCTSTSPLAPAHLAAHARSTSAALANDLAYPYTQPYFSWTDSAGLRYQVTWGIYGTTGTTTTQTTTHFQPTITKTGLYSLKVTAIDEASHESSQVVLLYRFRPAQLLISSPASATVLNSKGVKVRSLSFTAGSVAPYVTGGTITVSGEDRYLLDGQGQARFYKTTGQSSSTMQPFGSSNKLNVSLAVLRRAGQSALYAAALADGSEVRIVTSKGALVKRLILGNGKLKGLTVAAADIDADGVDEFVAADRKGSAIRLYRATGQLIKTITPLGKTYTGGWAVALGDVTADGLADIVAIPGDARASPALYVINPTGSINRISRLSKLKSAGPIQVTTADLDGNGRDDVIVFAPGKAELTVWTERGTRTGVMALSGDPVTRRLGRLP